MKPEKQRKILAELCGWDTGKKRMGGVYFYEDPQGNIRAALPDFLKDLNAVNQAELVAASKHGKAVWVRNLAFTVCGGKPNDETDLWYMTRATAAQRCEAVLRTIGKWKETAIEQE